ncbi:DNA gyrase inhibitor YacG [Bradyrhizobium sp. LHD-71]|uniref:DNA gyrase inhibitor YacG n=1 Tax=Bradyrhizobium sp. LHD-71 TaxID=3072141 RepID=UPI00280D7B89|nr:DNA gyrase inhibitor YacG [Bradyrhizobium sp. LHD-71]MDQ8732462.1 DNA gyrase inhibitor YacG [Bradyrhizobium sp. LHD-71]
MATAKPRRRKCPICGKLEVEAFRPFCSERCKSLDLHRWLTGGYVIPVSEDDDEDGQPDSRSKPPED